MPLKVISVDQATKAVGGTPSDSSDGSTAAPAFPRFEPNAVKQGLTSKIAGFAANASKSALNTLVVKPAVYATQAVESPILTHQLNKSTEQQNAMTNQINTLLGVMKNTADPVQKDQIHQQILQLVQQQSGQQQTAQVAQERLQTIDQPTEVSLPGAGTFDAPNIQPGARGLEQAAGNTLEAASYLAAPEGAGVAGEGTSLAAKVAKGAAVGAGLGGAAGAGGVLADTTQQPTLGKLAAGTGEGAAEGAVIGAGGTAALEGAGAAVKAFRGAGTAAVDGVDSRITDATPSYNKSLIGKNVKTVEGDIVPRVNESGAGGARTVTTSASEHAAGTELKNVPDYPDNGTALQKAQAVNKAIGQEAEGLRTKLADLDKSDPLNKEEAHTAINNHVLNSLYGDAKDAMLERGKGIEGAADRSKTVVGRYGQDVADSLSNYDGSREGILQLRQDIDDAYKVARGKLAFNSDTFNQLDDMNSQLRTALNKELAESAVDATGNQDAGVADSLKKQSNLYNAQKVLNDKARAEAATNSGRYFQQHPFQKRIYNGLTRRAALLPVTAALGALGYNKLHKAITDAEK